MWEVENKFESVSYQPRRRKKKEILSEDIIEIQLQLQSIKW